MTSRDWIDIGSRTLVGLVTVIGALFGVRWGVALALRRFQAEKWWELQSQNYVKALMAVGVIKYAASIQSDHHKWPSDWPGASDKLIEAFGDALLEVERQAAVGPVFLSKVSIEALTKLTHHWTTPQNGHPVEIYDDLFEKATTCLAALTIEGESIRQNQPSKQVRFERIRNIFNRVRHKN